MATASLVIRSQLERQMDWRVAEVAVARRSRLVVVKRLRKLSFSSRMEERGWSCGGRGTGGRACKVGKAPPSMKLDKKRKRF